MVTVFESRPFLMPDYTEVIDMCKANKEETSPLNWDLNVDVYNYLASDVRVFLALNEGSIVGYSIFRTVKHPHHIDKMVGFQDVLYIHPDFRKGFTGIRFYKYIENELKDKVDALIISHTFKKDLSSVYNRMGYEPLEVTYMKEI